LERDPKQLTRTFFECQLMLMTGAYSMREQPEQRFYELCETQGLDNVRKLACLGKGLLVVTFHFGTHLLSFVKLEQEGFSVTTVRPLWMKDLEGKKLRRMLFIDRETIYAGEGDGLASPVRSIVQALKDGKIVGFAPDGDQGGAMTEMPLLGGLYPMRRGLFEIVRLARCPVVYAQGIVRNRKYYIWYSTPMEPPTDGNIENFLEELWLFLQKRFEQFIRDYPESVWWTKPMEIALNLRKRGQSS
jgi:lauroyl/myristoyl acyltransferase